MSARRWTIPLAFLGLGGLGAMLLSERGQKLLRSMAERLGATPGQLAVWNHSAQEELDHIEQEVEELEHSLRARTAQ